MTFVTCFKMWQSKLLQSLARSSHLNIFNQTPVDLVTGLKEVFYRTVGWKGFH